MGVHNYEKKIKIAKWNLFSLVCFYFLCEYRYFLWGMEFKVLTFFPLIVNCPYQFNSACKSVLSLLLTCASVYSLRDWMFIYKKIITMISSGLKWILIIKYSITCFLSSTSRFYDVTTLQSYNLNTCRDKILQTELCHTCMYKTGSSDAILNGSLI